MMSRIHVTYYGEARQLLFDFEASIFTYIYVSRDRSIHPF
jgi:hypothetical protein